MTLRDAPFAAPTIASMDDVSEATIRRVIGNLVSDPTLAQFEEDLRVIGSIIDDGTPIQLQTFYDANVDEFASTFAPPIEDMCKCVGLDRYLTFYADEETREEYEFRGYRAYERSVLASADPSRRLVDDLPTDPDSVLIPAKYSWLIPHSEVSGLSSAEIVDRLRLRSVEGPLVVLQFPMESATRAGVELRPANGMDTIPAMDDYWRRGAVLGEMMDHDVPRAACEEVACLA